MISMVRPSFFRSIWMAVTPSVVPATLKSISPWKSSTPWMSVKVRQVPVSLSEMRPQEMPATGRLMGTPASIRASVEPQMEAWEVEPLEETTSETTRMAYGNSSTDGITGSRAFSASAPWPISRRPGERAALASPTE